MDIMLERMLSLIPKKEDGKYVHGAKKDFCESIGAPTNIVSEWEAGKTRSYRNYLYAVSAKYNVSVEWLKGETDEMGIKKERPADGEALTRAKKRLYDSVDGLSAEQLDKLVGLIEEAKKLL